MNRFFSLVVSVLKSAMVMVIFGASVLRYSSAVIGLAAGAVDTLAGAGDTLAGAVAALVAVTANGRDFKAVFSAVSSVMVAFAAVSCAPSGDDFSAVISFSSSFTRDCEAIKSALFAKSDVICFVSVIILRVRI